MTLNGFLFNSKSSKFRLELQLYVTAGASLVRQANGVKP